ncbi:MAG: dihydroneopterin aldolase [Candidatus Omnitrophica bacterium]|nr:dihydroneopterin aldolase [Candidatus Omnitrophota bacterium]
MATIRITNLKLRAVIGTNDWERDCKQDVLINVEIGFDASKASESDQIKDTIDYKALTKRIIQVVEPSNFFLLEKLAKRVLNIIMENPLVKKATVRIDKPLALRFADSVSVELNERREG